MLRAQLAALLEYQDQVAPFSMPVTMLVAAPMVRGAPEVVASEAIESEPVHEASALADDPFAPRAEHDTVRAPSCAAAPPQGAFSLQVVRDELGECTRCKLHATRKKIVYGAGSANAKLVFVGEGPGADEDTAGEPFVGKAGELLTKMIQAMGFERGDVYIANVVKCRPPNNRDPEPEEVAACQPFLEKQLQAIQPQVIVTLGKHAAHALLEKKTAITRLRGTWQTYRGTKLMPTFHPAYLLRDPTQKRVVWDDLKAVLKELK